MSEQVKRYISTRLLPDAEGWNQSVSPHTYVRASDHDALHAEVEALRAENARLSIARASLPVGVPDGWALVRHEAIEYLADQWPGAYRTFYAIAVDSAAAAPTVKAEQAPTPEFVWVRLLEALAGDNGCPFTASTDDYREAKPALVQLIAAGFFRDDADSLDGDIWAVAAGEQGEAAARFASCPDAYAVLSDVLNRVFDRPDEASSLPAAGSAEEEVEVVAWVTPEKDRAITALTEAAAREDGGAMLSSVRPYSVPCMTVAQHNRIVAALSAQQSAHVSVPRELLERVATHLEWLGECHCTKAIDSDEHAALHQLAFELGGTDDGEYLLDADAMDKLIVAAWQRAQAAWVPEARVTVAWESARIGDFNAGWNACRDAAFTLMKKAAYMELDTTKRSIAIQDELRALLNEGEA